MPIWSGTLIGHTRSDEGASAPLTIRHPPSAIRHPLSAIRYPLLPATASSCNRFFLFCLPQSHCMG
jgi:hypothetical protein